MLRLTTKNPHRSYCHPVDESIIRVLDNPIINGVFRELVAVSADAFYGQVLATGIPVNEGSFPGLHRMVKHCTAILRIPMPYVIVSNSVGFNAFTLGSDKEPYIVLGSMLVKAMTEEQLHFVIGHECGHIAMGHVVYRMAASTATVLAAKVPILGDIINSTAGVALKAWSRRSEISADRAGLLCCGDLTVAQRSLLQLEMGLIDTETADLDAYLRGSRNYRSGGILRRLGEYFLEHPLLPKRIEALELFTKSKLYFALKGLEPPGNALSDAALQQKVEKLVRVL